MTRLHIIGVDPDTATIARLRQRFDRSDYGTRVAFLTGNPTDVGISPYVASLIATETPDRFTDPAGFPNMARLLRPYGGTACLPTDDAAHQRIRLAVNELSDGPFSVTRAGRFTVVRRSSGLPGATNYAGGWQSSQDVRVRAPLGVLWFDDGLGHFKRSPQPKFIDGLMISYPKDWHAERKKGDYSIDYPLFDAELSDVYTGRVLGKHEAVSVRQHLEKADPDGREPSQYRPPTQRNEWKPDAPSPGRRINPLTGETEPRTFPKSYGCDGGLDYGQIFTMRSGTPAFYDKTLESGTICISGPRSGCTNSVIPANGLLNIPYFYEGCTCSYPLPVGLAMVAMPETHEQWASWGPGQPKQIQRVGINFGAPGDRMTREGTLWLDFPSVGGPSPELAATALPQTATYHYRHSVWMAPGAGWPWVISSGVEGLSSFVLRDLKPGRYLVRLYFADRAGAVAGTRIQSVDVQRKTVLKDFDISAGGGGLRGVVPEFLGVVIGDNGTFELNLTAKRGQTLISGLELVRDASGK